MKRAYVDANVVVRLVTGDPPAMADAAESMFRLVNGGELELVIEPVVIADAVWLLSSSYGFSPSEIAPILRAFLAGEGIIGEEKDELLEALQLYEDKNVDFVDALLAVRMTRAGALEIYSFDKHFDRLEGIRRRTPGR